eukprot:1675866-Pleurochrysis_carterae.AAC.1
MAACGCTVALVARTMYAYDSNLRRLYALFEPNMSHILLYVAVSGCILEGHYKSKIAGFGHVLSHRRQTQKVKQDICRSVTSTSIDPWKSAV